MKSKYIFKDHKESIEEEHEALDTYVEKTKINDDRCSHESAEIIGRELVCKCGAAWGGTAIELQEAYNFFNKKN